MVAELLPHLRDRHHHPMDGAVVVVAVLAVLGVAVLARPRHHFDLCLPLDPYLPTIV